MSETETIMMVVAIFGVNTLVLFMVCVTHSRVGELKVAIDVQRQLLCADMANKITEGLKK